MNNVQVLIQRLPGNEDIPLPQYMTSHSAGMDIHAAVQEDVVVPSGERALIPTGFKIAIPQGYEGQMRPRSGLALKYGITFPNAPGTIDADYRGEVGIILANIGAEPFTVRRGDRIAQLVITPVMRAQLTPVDNLENTTRGEGGFGHTG